ncbi:tetratricopeptide repeat protein [Chloroflexota bacterium]
MDKFEEAVNLASSGRLEEAKNIFEEIILEDPRNSQILYNLGMCFTDLNQPDQAIKVLEKSIEYNPNHSNSYVALGYAYSKMGDSESAEKYFLDALKLDPDNSYAMRNLGGLYGKTGDTKRSVFYLEKAYKINPQDSATTYGLGYSYQQAQDYSKADTYYRKVLEMNAPSDLKELTKNGLREIAVASLKSKGLRMDAVMYMVSALELFEKESESRIKEIAFETAFKGREGLDINNPDNKYTIRSLPGVFTGLQLVSYMYVGFKKIAPDQDVGVDLSQEYNMALTLFKSKEVR